MLLSLFQRELVFSLSGKKNCLNENSNVWTCKELRKQKWKKIGIQKSCYEKGGNVKI